MAPDIFTVSTKGDRSALTTASYVHVNLRDFQKSDQRLRITLFAIEVTTVLHAIAKRPHLFRVQAISNGPQLQRNKLSLAQKRQRGIAGLRRCCKLIEELKQVLVYCWTRQR